MIDVDGRKWETGIIPVEKKDGNYILIIAPIMWNSIQMLILEGAQRKKITVEFDIKK